MPRTRQTPIPPSSAANSVQIERALLNVAASSGITANSVLAGLRRTNPGLTVQHVQEILDRLELDGAVYTTRTMKKTTFHTTVARRAGRSIINTDTLNRVIDMLGRTRLYETGRVMAHRLSLPLDVTLSHLDHAAVTGKVKARKVGALTLYGPLHRPGGPVAAR